jgi:hypothetical protein
MDYLFLLTSRVYSKEFDKFHLNIDGLLGHVCRLGRTRSIRLWAERKPNETLCPRARFGLLAVAEIDRVDEVRGIQLADSASVAGSDDLASVRRSKIHIEQHA